MPNTDERIKKQIVENIFGDSRVNGSGVNVSVQNGRVTLSGWVPTLSARRAAQEDAWAVPDVLRVDNLIDVKFASDVTPPVDADIKSAIEASLRWNPDIDATRIRVSVNAGNVTLEGSVEQYWKKILVENMASDVRGVVVIINIDPFSDV